MSTQPQFQNGDNVYLGLMSRQGMQEYYEAVILSQSGGYYTLASYMPGLDGRTGWLIVPNMPRDSLGSEARRPAPRADGAQRGAPCYYVTQDNRGCELGVDAFVLNHTAQYYYLTDGTSAINSVYDIAYRSQSAAGWTVAMNIDASRVRFAAYWSLVGGSLHVE